MLKPTEDEMNEALRVAEQMREDDRDLHHIAKSLQYFHERIGYLETVFDAANRYIRFGQDEREHAALVRAVEAVGRAEGKETDYLA